MEAIPALLVPFSELKGDSSLQSGNRGARKIIVTELYAKTEREATEVRWRAPTGHERCPVWLTQDTEVAVFNQYAKQDRHYHKQATEIYIVQDGSMTIDVDGTHYHLATGDMIVVKPGAVHEIMSRNSEFICRVVTVNCRGLVDKFVVPGNHRGPNGGV